MISEMLKYGIIYTTKSWLFCFPNCFSEEKRQLMKTLCELQGTK
jgi:hypothetical protein